MAFGMVAAEFVLPLVAGSGIRRDIDIDDVTSWDLDKAKKALGDRFSIEHGFEADDIPAGHLLVESFVDRMDGWPTLHVQLKVV